MHVRNCIPEDLPFIGNFIVETAYEKGVDATLDFGKISQSLIGTMLDPDFCAFALVNDGELIGCFIGCLQDNMFNTHRTAYETFMFIQPKHRTFWNARRLIEAFEEWAASFPDVLECRVMFLQPNDINRHDGLFTKMGYTPVSSVNVKRIHQ